MVAFDGVHPEFVSSLGDRVASRTEWTPLRSGGSSFRVRSLVRVSSSRVELKGAKDARGFLYGALGMASLTAVIALYGLLTGALYPAVMFGAISALCFATAAAFARFAVRPLVFDQQRGLFWRGAEPKGGRSGAKDDVVPLNRVHALQLLARRHEVFSDESAAAGDYVSYELNLVLGNGRRVNVTVQGGGSAVVADAFELGKFLEVPVWDAR